MILLGILVFAVIFGIWLQVNHEKYSHLRILKRGDIVLIERKGFLIKTNVVGNDKKAKELTLIIIEGDEDFKLITSKYSSEELKNFKHYN